jgi:hypothetical protein
MNSKDPRELGVEFTTPSPPPEVQLAWQTASGHDQAGQPVATVVFTIGAPAYATTYQLVLRPDAMERLAADLKAAAEQARSGLIIAPANALPPAGNGHPSGRG